MSERPHGTVLPTAAAGRPRPIELLRVAGSHAAVGEQIGDACGDLIRTACAAVSAETIAAAAPYRAVTARELPWLVEELDGVARAALVDPLALFATGVE